jgi:hypothetical protein
MAVKYARLFRGVNVIDMPDRTADAEAKAQRTGARLHGVAESVRIGTLPLEIGGDKGDDARDVLKLADGEKLLRQAVDDAEPWEPTTKVIKENADRPVILDSTDESKVINESIEAVATTEKIYQRAGLLVHVVRDSKPPKGIRLAKGTPRITIMPPARLRELLSDAALFCKLTEDVEPVPIHPPKWVVDGISARGEWGKIPPLEGVTECPVVRPDGSILQTPGYDVTTGLLYEPSTEFPEVPERPTAEQTEQAACKCIEIVRDFPFEKETHKAAWLAGLLTPLARSAIDGAYRFGLRPDTARKKYGDQLLNPELMLEVDARLEELSASVATDSARRSSGTRWSCLEEKAQQGTASGPRG